MKPIDVPSKIRRSCPISLRSSNRIFLQRDARKTIVTRPVVPEHIQQVFSAVVVMEQGRIEAAAIQIDWIGPLAVNARRGHQIVVRVPQRRPRVGSLSGAPVALHVGVDQIEKAVGVAQAGRPDAARIGVAEHVELGGAVERARQQAPMNQIARVVDLDPRIPFESRGGDVVVVADADNRRVRIESRQNRIADRSWVGPACQMVSRLLRSRTSDQRTAAPTKSSTPRQTKNGA